MPDAMAAWNWRHDGDYGQLISVGPSGPFHAWSDPSSWSFSR
jgi:hypothetical protein